MLYSKKRDSFFRSFDETDSIMDSLFGDIGAVFGNYTYKNADGDYIQEIECPGFNKENLSIDLTEGILTVSGERKNGEGFDRNIYKRFRLGTYESVEAKIEDGILYLTIKAPREKKQKIEIK